MEPMILNCELFEQVGQIMGVALGVGVGEVYRYTVGVSSGFYKFFIHF